MNESNGEQDNRVTSDHFPGGNQQEPLVEPVNPEAPTQNSMGCTSSNGNDMVNNDTQVKAKPENGQPKIEAFFKPSEKIDDRARRTSTGQSPKRTTTDDDDASNKRPKSKTSAQSVSNDDDYENNSSQRRSGPVTRSLASLSKLHVTFDNSDDDDNNSSYSSSWAQRDISEYRNNYPHVRSDPKITDNYDFYTNKVHSHPDGDFIDNIHNKWFGDYRKLEYHHGYIQWLFPLQEKGLNWSAEPLQKHEIVSIKKDKKALKRVLKSYELMLDFYGFEFADSKTGEIRRLPNNAYKERFHNLNTSSHNYLRITRILKCLGEFDYEYLKFPFLESILRESITENTLPNCLRSCKDYWIETLRSQSERRAIRQYARDLVEYRNKGITPPLSHRASRPPATSATATQIENMSISENEDNNENTSYA